MTKPFILCGEDDENDAFLLNRAFEKAGDSHLTIVPDGQAVVDYLSGETVYANRATHPLPGLVLLDINMPRLSGLEALAWIRQQPEFKVLPVVMLTSSLQGKDLARAYALGASAFLVKPGNAATLVEVAKRLVQVMEEDRFAADAFNRIPGFQARA